MCATCGCSGAVHSDHEHAHERHHAHDEHAHDHHAHDHAHDDARVVRLERDLLEKNARFARANRAWLGRRDVLALNLVSSPGAGKTTLLERTVRALEPGAVHVIEGDQETDRDAARVRAAGARAVQINTGTGCHLDAHQIGHALEVLDPPPRSVVLVENVGNLVCPALFDLGEHAKVALLSVPEGDDKPLKYPHMFRAAELLVVHKVDLLPYVMFDVARCARFAREVNPRIEVLEVSSATGAGMDAWIAWIERRRAAREREGEARA